MDSHEITLNEVADNKTSESRSGDLDSRIPLCFEAGTAISSDGSDYFVSRILSLERLVCDLLIKNEHLRQRLQDRITR
jgi:hypothetical protein